MFCILHRPSCVQRPSMCQPTSASPVNRRPMQPSLLVKTGHDRQTDAEVRGKCPDSRNVNVVSACMCIVSVMCFLSPLRTERSQDWTKRCVHKVATLRKGGENEDCSSCNRPVAQRSRLLGRITIYS